MDPKPSSASPSAPASPPAAETPGGGSLLLTDLYELNMTQAYLEAGMTEPAVFEFFVRKLPERRGFLMAAGLEQVLGFLETARPGEAELDWLRESGRFSADLIDYLANFNFSGEVHAMPEGTVFFPDEPILRVTAPLPEAQLVETRVINLLHFQVLVASKAARMVLAAPGKALVDFGLRRAHGAEAGLLAARASYLAGFASTATTPAAWLFGIPISGTMAAHDDETESFARFARSRPDNVVLLLDTYDTERAAHRVVDLAPKLRAEGIEVAGVRLDSGDLAALARRVRRILDDGGLRDVKIVASGGIDEDALQVHRAEGAPIDGYGIGTSLTTSSDAPALDCAYKLQAYAGRARRKRSAGKATWPGAKQVFRRFGEDGAMAGDLVTLEDDRQPGTALIRPVMRGGRRCAAPSLGEIRETAGRALARLPGALRGLVPETRYRVEISPALRALAERVDREERGAR
jgi:nicotinate phosphoribosyltransferase